MWVLDPTSEDVMSLDDVTLRELVRRLCEAEAKVLGISASGIIAGGHQDAKDGGIDVAVDGDPTKARGWLPRLPLGFQAKATAMDARAIIREMKPKGILRESIVRLAKADGAYVVACGKVTITGMARDQKIATMRATFTEGDAKLPHFDFYDASRLADWARQHRGVALWLLQIAGRPTRGWSPLSNWSAPSEGLLPDYLVDTDARLSLGSLGSLGEAVDVVSGIEQLRSALRGPRKVVRLLGQSGMGKTRLVQALFDDRVGASPLPADAAIYGDGGEANLEVSPVSMARRLIENGDEAILIVDNCPAQMHARLSLLCQDPATRFSLLTVDFDVGPDQPDNTVVARLQRAGDDLIRRLLQRRARHLNHADIERVTEFSEGNTRIALALAGSAEISDSLALLNDQELLDRLFLKDRREPDPIMRQVARVASLVYAFYVEGESDAEELRLLCELADVSKATFFEKLGDTLERGIAQQRGRQRAILPQALAAHLAKEALRRIPAETLFTTFTNAPVRLRTSFSRRLGTLHDEPIATQIALRFLAADQPLSRPSREDKQALELITNFAPVASLRTLEILEDYVARHGATETLLYTNQAARQVTALLCHLTYEADLFDRAARLLSRLVIHQDESRMIEQLRPRFTQLFQIIRSDTHATPSQRFALMDELIDSSDAAVRLLGLHALEAALNTRPNNYQRLLSFGAKRRTAGWWPTQGDDEEVRRWFASAFERCERLIEGSEPVRAKTVLAKAYPNLVRITAIADQIVEVMKRVSEQAFWGEGWFAACEALHGCNGGDQTDEMLVCEEALRPRTLAERFDAFMLRPLWDWHDPAGASDSFPEGARRARNVGLEAATAGAEGQAILDTALRDLNATAFCFGMGWAEASQDLDGDWERLLAHARCIDREKLNASTIVGFFNGARQRAPVQADSWMDAGLADALVSSLIPWLETDSGEVSTAGVRRIVTALSKGVVTQPVAAILSRLRPRSDVTPDDLAILVESVLDHGQPSTALYLLDAKRPNLDKPPWPPCLVEVGRRLLLEVPFQTDRRTSADYQLSMLADRVLIGPGAEPTTIALLERIAEAITADDDFWLSGLPSVVGIIAREHPRALLNAFVTSRWDGIQEKFEHVLKGFDDDDGNSGNQLSAISDDTIVAWMNEDLTDRSRRLARLIPYFEPGIGTDFQWTPIAMRLLEAAGDDEEVTTALELRFETGASSGDWTLRYLRRLPMLRSLSTHPNHAVKAWASRFHQDLVEFLARRIASALSPEPKFE